MNQTKKFREKEVQMRAAEFYKIIHKVSKSKSSSWDILMAVLYLSEPSIIIEIYYATN